MIGFDFLNRWRVKFSCSSRSGGAGARLGFCNEIGGFWPMVSILVVASAEASSFSTAFARRLEDRDEQIVGRLVLPRRTKAREANHGVTLR